MDKDKCDSISKPLELFELPELAQKTILSNLELVDLMSLRLSCKTLNSWVTTHKLSPEDQYPVRIAISDTDSVENEDRSWKSLLEPGTIIYRTKIRELTLTVHSESFYDDPEISTFLKIYGSSILKLKLNQFYVNSPGQTRFIESLVKLSELKIKYIHISETGGYLFPKNFEEIDTLKLDEIKIDNMSHQEYPYILLEKCSKLSALRLPKLVFQEPISTVQSEKRFRSLIDFCLKQVEKFGEKKLELVNVKNINDLDEIQKCQSAFLLFKKFAEHIFIELDGVSCDFLVLDLDDDEQEDEDFNMILGIQGFRPFDLCTFSLFDLRKIVIPSLKTEVERFSEYIPFPPMEYEWQFLESIKIHYDIKEKDLQQPFVHSMSELLFGNDEVDRPMMEEISISFAPHLLNVTIPAAVLPARNIVDYCIGITKLELINWNPANKAFLRLWSGLPGLEELIIENCPSLGNVGFIGQDVNKPAFLELNSLKKLTLKLDLMPKVTERAFKDVFRHMELKEFILKSDNPLENIGVNAINWLLDGVFSSKIQRFPFNTWSSTTIPASQMLELKSQFRSLLY